MILKHPVIQTILQSITLLSVRASVNDCRANVHITQHLLEPVRISRLFHLSIYDQSFLNSQSRTTPFPILTTSSSANTNYEEPNTSNKRIQTEAVDERVIGVFGVCEQFCNHVEIRTNLSCLIQHVLIFNNEKSQYPIYSGSEQGSVKQQFSTWKKYNTNLLIN